MRTDRVRLVKVRFAIAEPDRKVARVLRNVHNVAKARVRDGRAAR